MSTLGEVADFVMGQAPPGTECNCDGIGTPFVKAGEFSDPFPAVREWTTRPLKLGTTKDVFVCVVGATSGKINLGIDCAIGRSVAAVRPKNGKLNQHYLYYFLGTWTQRLRTRSQGVAQGVITREMLSAIEIPLWPLSEQKRIADILDKADAIRRKRWETVEQVECLPEANFLELFGNPLSNDRGWPIQEIGTLARVTKLAGFEYTKHFKYRDHGDVIAIRGVNVKQGRLKLDDVHYIDHEVSEILPRSQLFEGNIVMTYIGVNMGDVAYVPHSGKYHLGPNVAKITTSDREILHPLYLMQFLSMYRSEIARKATNTAKAAFNMSNIRQVRLPVPPGSLQMRFADAYMSAQRTLDKLEVVTRSTDDLFHSLAQRAFRGEL